MPSISLPAPKNLEERTYLGLSGGGSFRIPGIKARIVIIEIFSLSCPPCLKMGSVLKDLEVALKTLIGGHRILDMLTGGQYPRIC